MIARGNARQDIVRGDKDRVRESTLVELAERFGLSRPDRVPNLTRRVDVLLKRPGPIGEALEVILMNLGLEDSAPKPLRRIPRTKYRV